MKNLFTLLFTFVVITLIASCRPEEEFCDDPTNRRCPNFDICTEVVAANSDFIFVAPIQIVGQADTLIDLELNKAYGGAQVKFRAINDDLASYSWKVGDDPREFSDHEIFLSFNNFSGTIPVTLTTTANNSEMCLENYQLRDEVTKEMTYISRDESPAIDGVFKGTLLQEIDEQEYEVQVINSLPPYRRLHGLPLPNDCDFNGRGIPLFYGYQVFLSTFTREGPTPRCRNLTVVGRIDMEDNDLLRIEYVYDDDDGSRKTVVFEGRRQ